MSCDSPIYSLPRQSRCTEDYLRHAPVVVDEIVTLSDIGRYTFVDMPFRVIRTPSSHGTDASLALHTPASCGCHGGRATCPM